MIVGQPAQQQMQSQINMQQQIQYQQQSQQSFIPQDNAGGEGS